METGSAYWERHTGAKLVHRAAMAGADGSQEKSSRDKNGQAAPRGEVPRRGVGSDGDGEGEGKVMREEFCT